MSSIFNRIFQYRQREQRTPREDYFTETFVAVIEKYDELRIALAAWLSEVEEIRSVRIETQRGFTVADSGKPRRPDIWMEAKDAQDARHWIIVENKIDSGEGENQLADYAKILKARPESQSSTLVYLTKYSSATDSFSDEGVRFKHLRWSKVYEFLQEHKGVKNHRELVIELLRLMEDWNMDGRLSTEHLRAAVICFDYEVGKKLQIVQDDAWKRSGIGAILDKKLKWQYTSGEDRGGQWGTATPGAGISLEMGFRFDRRDKIWDVTKVEIPSPYVAMNLEGESRKVEKSILSLLEFWTDATNIQLSKRSYKWVKQPVNIPRMGEPLNEYYEKFFYDTFVELKQALEGIQ